MAVIACDVAARPGLLRSRLTRPFFGTIAWEAPRAHRCPLALVEVAPLGNILFTIHF